VPHAVRPKWEAVRRKHPASTFSGGRLPFEVSDTGTASLEKKRSLIFEAFSEPMLAPSLEVGGTGLGWPSAASLQPAGRENHLQSTPGRAGCLRLTCR